LHRNHVEPCAVNPIWEKVNGVLNVLCKEIGEMKK
jgi:hypothetical protein